MSERTGKIEKRRSKDTAIRLLCGASLSALVALGIPSIARAQNQDRYWDPNKTSVGTGGSDSWDITNSIWSSSSDGVSGPYGAWDNAALDNAIFAGTAGTVTLSGPITVHNLTFQTNGYSLTGGSLTLGGTAPIISVTTGTTTIGTSITSAGGWTKAGGGNLTLNGANSFGGGIDITGGGWLSLNAANSFTGTINATGGHLGIGAIGDAALGSAANQINLGSGRTFSASGTISASRTINLTGGIASISGGGLGAAFYTGAGGLNVANGIALTNNANNYQGQTQFTGVPGWGGNNNYFSSIGNLGEASALGAPTTVANGTILLGPGCCQALGSSNLIYTGTGNSSDRNWNLRPGNYAGGAFLYNNGSGALTLTGDISVTGGSRSFGFGANSADLNLLGVISSNSGRSASFSAGGGQTLRLGIANTFSGTASISGAGMVEAALLSNAGVAGSLGTGAIAISGGNLSYVGAGEATSKSFTISNGSLNNNGAGALTLSGTMGIGGTATLGGSFTGADNIVSGVISGSGNLRSNGAGTWVISGVNTYTGQTIVDSGILRAGTANAFGASTTAQVNGGTLDLNDFDKSFNTLTGTGGTVDLGSANLTLQAAAGTTATYAGNITGSGGLTKLGASTQTLTGANSYTGATMIGGGTLALDFRPAGGPASDIISGASTLNMAGGVLNIFGAASENNTQTFNGLNITGSNNSITATSGSGGSLTVNLGAINRTGGLMNFNLPAGGNITTTNTSLGGWATVNGTDYAKVVGGNILAFTDADYTDKDNAANWLDNEYITDVAGFFGTVTGTKQLAGLRYTRPVSSTVNVDTGETLGVDGAIIVAPTVAGGNQLITGGRLTGANGGDLGVQQNSTGNFTIASQIVDNGTPMGFVKAGTGLVTLSNSNNSYTGATRVAQGTLSVVSIGNGGAASSIGASSSASSNLSLEGATLTYTGAGDISDRGFTFAKSGAILSSGVQVTNANANLVLSGLVTSPDGADFIKSGAGTLTLANGANDFTGVVTVNGGLLGATTLADGGQASSIGAGSSASSSLVLNGGGLQYTGGTTTTNRGFTLGASGGIVDVSTATTTLTNSGILAGTGRLTKNGAGTLVLSGANTYTGGNTVNSGVLRAGAANALGGGGPMTLADTAGVLLDLNNYDTIVGALNGGGANGGNITLGSATLRINGGNGVYSGVISGSGGIWRTGGGTQTFNGCNHSYTGATTLQGATITTDCLANGGQASGIGASSSASANLVFNSGALNYTGGTIDIDRGFNLVGYGVINVVNGTTLGFSGQVIGGGELYKDNAGTMVLSGNNSYTNNTRVRGGILRAGSATAFGTTNSFWLDNTAGVLLDMNNFDANAGALIGGGSLGGNIAMGTGTLTIRNGLGQTYAGAISGSGSLIKNGTGTQILSGCNSSYTGATAINAGVLTVSCLENGGVNSAIGASDAAPANLTINGTLRYVGGGSSTDRQFTLGTSGGTLDASGTGIVEFTNTAPVTLAGTNIARTLTLTGTNTGANLLAARLDNNGSGVSRLTKTGTGTWRLTNQASSYTGATTISGGILIVDKLSDGGIASSIGASSDAANNLVIGNGSTLRYVGTGDSTDRRFTLDTGVTYIQSSGTGALVFRNTGTVGLTGTNAARTIALGGTNTDLNTMGGAIADNGTGKTTLAKNDSGTWVLTGNNSFTGNTVINDGNLMIGNGGTTGNAGAGNVIVDSATSTLSLNRSDSFTFSGTLSGPGTLAQIGTGTSILTSQLNDIGATTISAGTLQIGDGTSGALTTPTLAMTGNSALVVNGTLQAAAGAQTLISGDTGSQNVTLGNGVTMRAAGNLGDGADRIELFGTVNTGGGTLSLGTGDDALVLHDGAGIAAAFIEGGAGSDLLQVVNAAAMTVDAANVNGFERLEKQAAGVLTLTGNHSYSDGTTIAAGTLRIGNGGASGTLAGDVVNNALLEFNRSGTLGVAGVISGTGAVRQIGSGTTVLTGTNSYQGGTSITAGTLQVSSDANLGAASGGLTLSGGRLNTTASFTSGRAVALAGAGHFATDAGTTLTLTGAVSGPGTLTKSGTGTLTLAAANGYTGLTTISAGTLQIGNGGTTGSIAGNVLNNSALVFNRSGTLTMGGAIIGGGSVTQAGPGTTILTGNNSYAGPTSVNSGTLLVNGNQSGATNLTSVASGATIGGTGTIGGNVTIADGGTLAAGSNGVGALTINGNLALGNASLVDFEFGQANVPGGPLNDLVNVGGNLTLDGVVNVTQTPGGSFGPGVYRMFNYAGALTNNGLAIGAMPPGSDVFVQTAIAGQVNLANTAGLTLNFWDGSGQPKNDSVIQGGDGVWRVGGNQNDWTEVNGTVNADYAQASFAIFQGTGGTVTVDNVGGNVLSAGMQFTVDGYAIAGGPLTLTGADAFVRVGDGTAADAGLTATIDATLAGSARLVKDLGGTLVLTGANTYTGGTAIDGGTLRIASDANLGDVAGGLSFGGGTLNTTASIASARAVDLAGTGTFLTNGGTTLTLAGSIGGGGALTKAGAGSLVFTAANTYTGGTTINAGLLQIGDGGTSGSLTGDVTNNASLAFNRSDLLTFAGAITGSGAVSQIGSGTTILTGASNYGGGTTISAGTLQIGNGGTTGSIAGNVLNNSALVFNRSGTLTMGGAIIGGGSVTQAGPGTTILTGNNSYAGPTSVGAGTLLINGNQSGATGATSVASGAALGGTGTIGGDVSIADGGILAPGGTGGPGTLTINGNLALGNTSQLNFEFGQANVVGGAFNDLVNVGGNLTLDGVVNVTQTPGGSFGPGIYRMFNYAGALTDNGLAIGAMPPGSDVFVQTAIAGQVNLANTAGLTLNFWDGSGQPKNDGVIQGGDGVWRVGGNQNDWTEINGTINADYAQASFAIFQGTGGTVTVDNVGGNVLSAGMQFTVDGYAIAGGPLTLTGADAFVRVGDGNPGDEGITATIAAELSGTARLVKDLAGTLVLTGTNSYTGGTAINGGTLSISSDANLGDAAGGLNLNGGTLNTTATFNSARGVDLTGVGTFATDIGTTLTLSNVVSGAGTLTKEGTGSLILTGANTYAGGTTISAGTLQIGNGGTTGSITGDVTNNGVLAFNRSNSLTFAGIISGTGALTKAGMGNLILTGANIYTGGTTVTGGRLQLGDGTTAGSIVGDVALTNSLLWFQTPAATIQTFTGTISGNGGVAKAANGTTILTGPNTYTGQTTVTGGTLLVNGDQSAATGLTAVNFGGILGGSGVIGGDVNVASRLAPGGLTGPGTLTINGNLTLAAGANVDYDFGQANVVGGAFNDLVNVGGDVTLDGTLNVVTSGGGSFDPGIYRVINYGGALTNNGLTIGTIPPGTDFYVQTSVVGQVNLINTNGLALRFWDGAAGGRNDGIITGGDGIWQNVSGNDNWTLDDASINAPFLDSAFAVFGGVGGTVDVDNGLGAVRASGMQFAVDGYTVTGQDLTLVGPQSVIRVGDGTAGGVGYTATFDSTLTADGDLVKTDLGTLVLTGTGTVAGDVLARGGELRLAGGGTLASANAWIAPEGGDQAIVTVTGADSGGDASTWTVGGDLNVGHAGTGTLNITNGGRVTSNLGAIGGDTDGIGSVQVTGAGSTWDNAGRITVGIFGAGSLRIEDGATVRSQDGQVGVSGQGDAVVSGAGASWINTTQLTVGSFGAGTLRIENGASVTSNQGYVGANADGSAVVTGAGSNWLVTTFNMTIGNEGMGALTIADGGLVRAQGGFFLGNTAASSGAVAVLGTAGSRGVLETNRIAAGLGSIDFSLDGGVLRATQDMGSFFAGFDGHDLTLGTGGGIIDTDGHDIGISPRFVGAGGLTKEGLGTLTLTGASNYAGVTLVNAGTLLVNGDQSGALGLTSVVSGASLGGTGTIGGDVTLADGAILTPGAGGVGTLTINGNLALSAGSVLDYAFGQANVAGGALNDLVNVGGDLALAGTLNVTVPTGGNFGPGIYRVFNYGGTLTDNGLTLGTMPTGSAVSVQTAIAGQVNLVNTAGLTLSFWDGAAGPKNNGAVNGGDGVWRVGGGQNNWADAAGTTNADYAQGSFAIFSAAPGMVTIDDVGGAVRATGMQFASDGYTITGDALTLTGAQAIVQVGDGSVAGMSYTATIDAALVGTAGLVKTDAGTLVLTGANSYTGGTAVNGGTLRISADTNLGDAAGGLSVNGGTLHTTADLGSARAVDLAGAGTFLTDGGTTLTLGGAVSGAGALTKDGAGSLLLTADNIYAGGTTIAVGTLQLGNGGTSGSIIGDVVNNAALVFNRSDAVTFAGLISGTGAFTQAGTGTTILTGASNYGGGTTISAGVLQLGAGGTSGSIIGNVLNNGALAFNRSDAVTYAGLISGTGTLTQAGSGTTLLTGANSYTGTTSVSAGTLLINGDQSLATGLTSVASGATIGGTGTIGGSVNVADGGTLAAGSNGVGALTINGNLALGNASLVDFEFGQANVPGGPLNDLVNVGGNLTLDGVVNVTQTPGGSFGPGVYRMFNYAGALTNNGLAIGAMPPGSDVFVQTAIAGQVNLANTAGLTLNFWDGSGQPKNDSVIQGGDGVWRVGGNQNDWTEVNGTVNADYAQASFAIFQGTGGTVTVDNVGGNVLSAGMQFTVDGYAIAGGPLTLTGADAFVRVGDGTAADAGLTATIDATLAGSARLVKDLGGTLVLTGANTYTGGTAIDGGTLRIASDANLGDVAGGLSFGGGTLNTTASIASARAVDLAGTGTFLTNGGTTLTLAGSIGGGGALTKAGAGSLVFTAANTYTGGTTINAGLLQIGDGGTSGSLTGDVTNNASLAFNRSDLLTFAGAITGSGAVSQIGSGTTILTGASNYGGGTTISAGTLQIGNGGTTGSIAGNVLNNSALVFNRSGTLTMGGAIIGGGSVTQAGPGTTILTGNNSYAGPTSVGAGTLLINGNQSGATGATSVASGAALGGTGTIGGDVSIADGGILAPGGTGGPGTLTINGNLALGNTSQLNFEFGQANVVGGAFNDLVNVGGNLTLDGVVNVTQTPGGSFGPGIYRVINYGGALTNNGLTIGTIPSGTDFYVQTSVANQVNLINTNGLALRFWDGAAGGRNDGVITGGDGVWQNATGNDNWTLDDATINAPFLDSAFAIFGAASGTVTIDHGLGAVRASGMQFTTDGYTITGDGLDLVGPQSVIRVGDGTAAALGMTATINAALTGASQLVKTDLGTLVLTGLNTYTGGTAVNSGTLQISSDANLGDAAGGLTLGSGTLHSRMDLTSNRGVDLTAAGTLLTDAGTVLTLAGAMSGIGGFTKAGDGALVLTGANDYAGDVAVNGGSLFVNGDQSGATGLTSIASGALLGGSGVIGGNVVLADGATLAAGTNDVGTLTINGNLALSAGSVLDYEFGQANVAGGALNDLVNVGGDLTLDGTINVSAPAGGSFGPGIYRAFNYGGTLTDNGLTFGTMPAGSMVSVQTAIAGQVNLVNTAGLSLSFWDGNAGPKNNGAVNGGDGVWRVGGGSNNWTDLNGSVNADYAQDSFAIFSAAPGTVTVDNSGGNVLASGMQFASDGYVVTGDALTLTGAQAIVQVGDSSVAGAGYTATIGAELTGTAGLVKTDAGTLVLTGTNSYSGGTAVTGGTLRVSSDANLGDAAGGLRLDGGTLNTTADMGSNRAVDLAGAGRVLTDGGTALTLNGAITGGGALTKDGAGALVLAADNAYAGGTTIAAGTLQLGNGGTSGSITGNVANDGILLFNRSDSLTFAGAISGSGALSQIGSGTTILTADNSYGGGTTIGAGVLQLGNGGTSGGITGNVVNNAALSFNRADTLAFTGLISGSGTLTQAGSGTTILTGANGYAGATNVSAGTLLINGDQSAATGATSVAAGATLGGTGIIGGNVAIADGATLAPGAGAAGALRINGSLALSGGSSLAYDFGLANAPGSPLNDVVHVGGDLTLDGTINVAVTPGGAFDIGLYRVINYGGTLTDNGLAIGTMPAGSGVFVQTAVANQINLINTGGVTLSFWDGAAGPKFNGAVNGGNGVWQSSGGNDNWADATGAVNAGYDDGAFAIFTGAPGTVTIDNGLGAVSASGMQFAVDGYSIGGGDLTLTGTQSLIRVGDGTAEGAGYTATIASTITGGSQLVKTDAGTLVLTGTNSYSGGTTVTGGTLRVSSDANLGDVAGGLSLNGGTFHTSASFGSARAVDLAGAGTILTDGGTTLSLTGAVSGTGALTKSGAGTLALDGTGSYAGGTAVTAGTLLVNGNYTGAAGVTSVASGASLGGTGMIGGDVTLASDATLTPGAGGAGTLTIGGHLSLASGSRLAWEFGEANVAGGALNDLVNVGGNLILDGTIDVTVPTGGSFDVGVYRMFNYGGTLTDNGLTLGAMPGGTVTVQTSIAGQVNLVNAAGLTLNFWDGAAGPKNNGVINGGSGIWQNSTGNDNWTDANGAVNAAYTDGAFAVFGGTGGTVTVDNGLGQVSAAGMQFAATGYTITGGGIALTGPQSTIRVGDGSTGGAGFTATINAALSGDTELVKTDAGTLVLGGTNNYTGGTRITGGTVQIASDANLGAASGAVTLDGGTLATSAILASTRGIVMAGAGTIATADGTTFTYGGTFSGTGALTKAGAGTLLVTSDNAGFGGTTNVAAGTLAITGRLGGAMTIASAGRLEGTGSVGNLTNSGTVAPGRDGFGVLTVGGSYTGSGGTLDIEAALGGDASQTDRLVVTNGTSGTTSISVTNRGGLGAQTVEGIKIIDVTGGTSAGTFTLNGDYNFEDSPAVIAGAFGYRLLQGGVATPADGDWYLRSALLDAPNEPQGPLFQPGVPLYESYAATLQTLNRLPTLQQRVGNRQWSGFTQGGVGMWGRMESTRHRPEAAFSTSGTDLDIDNWSLQAGLDKALVDNAEDTIIVGINGRYGTADARVRSRFGDGSIDASGYGVGATLTWYESTGFYADAQAQVTWFRSDLKSDVLGTLADNNHGSGGTFSLEVGKRSPVGGGLSITPQIQMIYSHVRFDSFVDPHDAKVSSDRTGSLKTRWGISLDHQKSWDGSGGTRRSHLYGIVNLSHEWLDGSIVGVSGTPLARRDERLWGEIGLGGSYSWNDDRFTLFAEISADTAIDDFGDSNSLRGNAGFRMKF